MKKICENLRDFTKEKKSWIFKDHNLWIHEMQALPIDLIVEGSHFLFVNFVTQSFMITRILFL